MTFVSAPAIDLNLSLDHLKPEELDSLWIPLMQATEHAQKTVLFYEQQLDQGKPVTISSLARAKEYLQKAMEDERIFQREFELRRGWNRVWLGMDGKMHQHRECAGVGSQILSFLSGLDEDLVLQRVHEDACLECYPSVQQHPAHVAAEAERIALLECPGSRRKALSGGCSACGRQDVVSPKGRAKVHLRES